VKFPDSRLVISFIHEGDIKRPLGFWYESSGTRKILNLAGDWWTLAHEPVTLFADELGASLHPRLLDRLIRAANDPQGKKIRSQLIFATHDVGLLEGQNAQPPALRRDQVYFTNKDTKGATELYSLAEFKDDARPVHNIRRRYLSGLYRAIPLVEKLSL
jgi:AAA15 family ATPase/GTPase